MPRKITKVTKPKIKKPKVGDTIYVPPQLYLSHGSDDTAGGRATVSKVYLSKSAGKDTVFVEVKELPGEGWNWEYLALEQAKLKKEYGKQRAHPDPDVDQPWIEKGDWVITDGGDGKVYNGPDVW